jgi:hypothetical protein
LAARVDHDIPSSFLFAGLTACERFAEGLPRRFDLFVLVYNLAAERRRMADVTAHLRKLLPEARIGISDKGVPNIANMNCENLRKDPDFKPRYTMETGLTEYVNAVRKSAGLAQVKA